MFIAITARMGSSRLPGKVLADICGAPLLQRLVERLISCDIPIMVCTSMNPENKPIRELADSLGVMHISGSENDVMERLGMAAMVLGTNTIIRVTADNPLTDPDIVKYLTKAHERLKADYTYTVGPPAGTKSEIINAKALSRLWHLVGMEERENMTPALKRMPKAICVPCPAEIYAPELRLTVDYPDDLERIRGIYERYDGNPPALAKIIADIVPRETKQRIKVNENT